MRKKPPSSAYRSVWVEKHVWSKYMGVDDPQFLIDKTEPIVKAWRKVKVPGLWHRCNWKLQREL